ncbi:MAG: hypothetical protein V3W20_13195, partial [Candidatus Neomarinimicrobiota bacterium]
MHKTLKINSFLLIFMLLTLIPQSVYSNNLTLDICEINRSSNNIQTDLSPSANMISLVEHSKFDDDGINERALGVAFKDDLAFIANYDQGLEILNISNPSKPEKISSIKVPNYAEEVYIFHNIAIVTSKYNGLAFVNIANPYSPTII